MSKRKKIRERRKEKEERYDRVACADTDASRAAGGRRQDTCMERQRERERERRVARVMWEGNPACIMQQMLYSVASSFSSLTHASQMCSVCLISSGLPRFRNGGFEDETKMQPYLKANVAHSV